MTDQKTQQKQSPASPLLGQGESKADFLYRHAPVGIWEEDWSEVKRLFDSLPPADRENFEQYLKADRSNVERFKRATKVLSVNPAALKDYGFNEDEHDTFIAEYDVYVADYMPDLVAFSKGHYVSTSISEELDRYGNKLIFRDVYCIPDGFRENWNRVICISQEVSDVLKHERIADEQLRHLEMAAKIAKIGYWTAGFGHTADVEFSGEYLDLMEFENAGGKVVQRQVNDAIHPDDKARVLEIFDEADSSFTNYSVDYRVITPSGKTKHLREIGEILKDNNGQPFSHHGIIQDISVEVEQHQQLEAAAQAVHLLEDQFMGAINALKVGIALFDSQHQLIKANNYFNVYFNEFSLELKTNKNCFYQGILQLINNDKRREPAKQKAEQWQQWFNGDSRLPFEYYDGYCWLTIHREALKDGSYVITLSDITDLKDRERQLQQKQDELEKLATKDAITNIYNRRKFNESINHEFRRSMRNRDPLSLIMCDIDWFKAYNDHYGHLKGDDCLKAVATAIQSCFNRTTDIVARYGGEEFAIILPSTDQALALQLANKVCETVRQLAIPHELSKHQQKVTVSVGVSTMLDCFHHKQIDLIDAADNALYEAKEKGRNCVVANSS